MMKRLLMTIAAIACLMLTSHAAPVPVCAPDDFDEALELMGAKTPEQKLDLTITILNNAYENLGDYIKVLKDDHNNKVVMLIDGGKLGVDVSDMTFNATDLMKGVFMSTLFDDDEDGAISSLFNVIINTGRSLEVKIYNDKDFDNAARLIFTPNEMRRAIEKYGVGSASLDEDYGYATDEAEDPETELKELIDLMEEYMSSTSGMDAHVWIDPHAKRVVMSMTSDDFADVKEYRGMVSMFKPLFLKTLVEDSANNEFLKLVTRTGRGLKVMLCAPGDEDNPMVLDYTADELMEALSDE